MMQDKKHIVLVIEDELAIRRFLKTSLVNQSYQYMEAKTGKEAIELVRNHKPDIILLDLGLPDCDGNSVIKVLRAWTTIPIIIISARENDVDKVHALDMGADDYLTKPFNVAELHARIRVALRHAKQDKENESPIISSGDFKVNLINREVWINDKKIQLSPTQYDIFAVLIRNDHKLVTHKDLLRAVWGEDHTQDIDYLRIFIYQLRNKIETNPAQPRYLITEPGIGYRLAC